MAFIDCILLSATSDLKMTILIQSFKKQFNNPSSTWNKEWEKMGEWDKGLRSKPENTSSEIVYVT